MNDFQFLQNPISRKWVILAPRRAKRPDVAKGSEPVCPFCPGKEGQEEELYRVTNNVILSPKGEESHQRDPSVSLDKLGIPQDDNTSWLVRVLPNKFPFAPIHELVVHTPEHGRNFGELPKEHVELIFKVYKKRYLLHQDKGQVYIFHNRGEAGGESLPHAHTQIAVVPFEVKMDVPRLDPTASVGLGPKPIEMNSGQGVSKVSKVSNVSKGEQNTNTGKTVSTALPTTDSQSLSEFSENEEQIAVVTEHFYLFCPHTSQWPDEVWVAPKKRGRAFGEITDEEISDLAFILPRLIKVLDLRHGTAPLPFNFHIYPGGDWYLRLVPRLKTLGGFEVGTGIYINTQDPTETIKFIKEHFENPDEEKIKREHQAKYGRHA